jgi:EAL domain-containing protein (putative c-di-GMP-specific phosphodiesterase class I)
VDDHGVRYISQWVGRGRLLGAERGLRASTSPSCDPQAAAMTRAIIELGSALGMLTVAAGVTSEAQRCFLVEQGCPFAQGFHFAKPLVAEEATERLQALVAGA